jgi:hypothetical protein
MSESMKDQLAAISEEIGQQAYPDGHIPTEEPEPVETPEMEAEALEDVPEDESVDEGDEPRGDEAEKPEIESLEGLAQGLEWEESDIYALKMPIRVGDKSEVKTLGEWKDYIQDNLEAPQKLAQEREAFETQAKQAYANIQQTLTQAQTLSNEVIEAMAATKAIEARAQTIDWESIEKQDAGAAANLRQKLSMEYEAAQQKQNALISQHQQMRGQLSTAQRQEQDQALLGMVPEWKDPAVAEREGSAAAKILVEKYGYSEEEVMGTVDARARKMANDLRKYHELLAKGSDTGKKLKEKSTRTLAPGKRMSGRRISQQKAEQMAKKARTTGNRRDKLAAGFAELQASGIFK